MSIGVDAPATIVFSLFYFIFCIGFVYQSKEFVGLGLSPENILSIKDWVGSEEMDFVNFQIRRSCGTFILHSLLPFGYLIGYSYVTTQLDGNYSSMTLFWRAWPQMLNGLVVSVLIPAALLSLVWYWYTTGWKDHPLVKKMRIYSEDWKSLSKDLNTEFRRIDKISLSLNPLERLVVTDNWILLLGPWPWSLHISHQSDSSLKLLNYDNHNISTEGELGGTQFLHIEVQSRKPGISSFRFRLNSLEYQNLQDKLTESIQNIKSITIYKTVSERFLDVFKEQVAQNDKVSVADELESCIGCMVETANVKLNRICESSSAGEGVEDRCVNCYCRPMWCIDCLGKWWASRQDQSKPETWLGARCPCPTCRSMFCMLDVSLITPG
ncbi:transmembrane protein 129 [Eurytemora carolleeae]|uniref:transmembrane protein 129 n=1 Tax=Eurytemora carolleeae TaxID=1294199 RepID=UPI000C774B47|nr:transmembrane protein 129 [Eurytemora carolleeae]|eukprot:XP_023344212.1 transmembrane protein 129-like [Eurytemora affinis]